MASAPNDPLALAAGDLFHVITILQQGTTTDISGTVAAYTTFATTRAKIDPFRSSDLIRAGQDVTQTFITVTIRWQTGITASMRVQTASGTTYQIQGIQNLLERNRVLKLTCLALSGDQ